MIDERVTARYVELELGDHRAAGRHRHGLDVVQRLAGDAAEVVDLVEDLTDDVERRGEVRTADTEVEPHRLADLGVQRMQLGDGADRPVEHEVFRLFGEQLLDTELLAAALTKSRIRVDLALHDVEFVIDRR